MAKEDTIKWFELYMEAWDDERELWCPVMSLNVRDDSIELSTGIVSFYRVLRKTKLRSPLLHRKEAE